MVVLNPALKISLLLRVTALSLCLALANGALANTLFENAPDSNTLWATGTAWTPDKSQVLYREFHFAEDPALDLPTRVQYVTPEGDVFAEKSINYSKTPTAPEVIQVDYRNQARLETRLTDNQRQPRIEVGFQAYDSNEFRRGEVPLRDNLVVDAGFDPFVRNNWEQLSSGRSVTAYFLVPARLDTVRISLGSADRRFCNAVSVDVHCFVIRPGGLLRVAGFLVDPVYIGYEQESRRLAMFSGLSNLRDDNGDPQNVLITYEYP